MSKQLVIQNDFSGGEVSPNVLGRFNSEIYPKSLAQCENMIPLPQGPVISRPPFVMCDTIAAQVKIVRYSMKKDIGASGADILVVFSDRKVSAWKNGQQMVDAAGDPIEAVTPFTWSQLPALSICQFDYYLVVVHPSHGIYVVAVSDDVLTSPPDAYIQCQKCTFSLSTGTIYSELYTWKPSLCAVFDGRIYFASTSRNSSAIIATAVPPFTSTLYELNINDTTAGVITAANAFYAKLTGTPHWIAPGKDLIIGTQTDERIIRAGTNALNFSAPIQTTYGSDAVQPVMQNDSIIFVGSDNRSLREYFYRDEAQSYQSPRLDLAADHLIENITSLAIQQGETPIVWLLDSNKTLTGIIHDRGIGLNGFFTISTPVDIESIAVINESGKDVLYAIARNGQLKCCLMRLEDWRGSDHQVDEAIEVAVTSGKLTSENWAFLVGATVSAYLHSDPYSPPLFSAVVAGNFSGGDYVSGYVNVPESIDEGTVLIAGIAYPCTCTLLPPVAQSKLGPAFMRPKTITGITVMLEGSVAPTVEYVKRSGSTWTALGAAALPDVEYPYTGEADLPMESTWDNSAQVRLTKSGPAPLKIIAIATEVDAGG